MKLEVGQTVKHTMAGPGGWHCANRTHRIGEVLKINVQRVTIRWEDGSKSSVGIDQVTILVMSKAA